MANKLSKTFWRKLYREWKKCEKDGVTWSEFCVKFQTLVGVQTADEIIPPPPPPPPREDFP